MLCLITSVSLACAFASIFNQITYTKCPDYFRMIKFDQFHVPNTLRQNGYDRCGVALVGVLASWWVGLVAHILVSIMAPDVAYHVYLSMAIMATAYSIFVSPWTSFCGTSVWSISDCGRVHNAVYTGAWAGLMLGVIWLN